MVLGASLHRAGWVAWGGNVLLKVIQAPGLQGPGFANLSLIWYAWPTRMTLLPAEQFKTGCLSVACGPGPLACILPERLRPRPPPGKVRVNKLSR